MKFLFLIILILSIFNSSGQTKFSSDSLRDIPIKEMIFSFKNIDTLNVSEFEKSELQYEKIKSFISTNPTNLYSAQFISWGKNFDSLRIDTLYNLLDSSLQKRVNESIKQQKLRSTFIVGNVFPKLSLADTLNQIINITDLKGKIIFIDVWASWCGPCRQEMPHLIKLHEKYKDEGFVIIAISLDNDKEKWLTAVKKDLQPWVQFCELKNWRDNSMLKKWGISGVPYNFLIDREGKLNDKEINLESLEAKIKRLL